MNLPKEILPFSIRRCFTRIAHFAQHFFSLKWETMNRLSQILFRFVYGLRHEMRYTLFQVFRAFWVRTLFSQCMKFRLEVWNRFVSHSHASVYKKPLNAIVMLHDLLGVRMWKKNVKPNFELYKKFRFCFTVSIHCAVNFYLCESSY